MHATPALADKLPSFSAHKPPATPLITLTGAEQAALIALLGGKKGTLERIERRVRIVLLAASGCSKQQIGKHLGISSNQVVRWVSRYASHGIAGIKNELPRGAPSAKLDVERLLELAAQACPDSSGRWSTRKMAAELGVSAATISRHCRKQGLDKLASRAPSNR